MLVELLSPIFAAYDGEDPVGLINTVAAVSGLSNRAVLGLLETPLTIFRDGSDLDRQVYGTFETVLVAEAAVFGVGIGLSNRYKAD